MCNKSNTSNELKKLKPYLLNNKDIIFDYNSVTQNINPKYNSEVKYVNLEDYAGFKDIEIIKTYFKEIVDIIRESYDLPDTKYDILNKGYNFPIFELNKEKNEKRFNGYNEDDLKEVINLIFESKKINDFIVEKVVFDFDKKINDNNSLLDLISGGYKDFILDILTNKIKEIDFISFNDEKINAIAKKIYRDEFYNINKILLDELNNFYNKNSKKFINHIAFKILKSDIINNEDFKKNINSISKFIGSSILDKLNSTDKNKFDYDYVVKDSIKSGFIIFERSFNELLGNDIKIDKGILTTLYNFNIHINNDLGISYKVMDYILDEFIKKSNNNTFKQKIILFFDGINKSGKSSIVAKASIINNNNLFLNKDQNIFENFDEKNIGLKIFSYIKNNISDKYNFNSDTLILENGKKIKEYLYYKKIFCKDFSPILIKDLNKKSE